MEITPVVRRNPWSLRDQLLGAAGDMQKNIVQFGSYIQKEYGDYVKDRFFLNEKCIFLFHPEAIEHVLVSHHEKYTKEVSLMQALKILVGNGLITSEGELWLRQRRMLQPFFHRKTVESYIPRMLERIDLHLQTWGTEKIVDIPSEMSKLTLEILIDLLFQKTTLDAETFMET